jgi:hypothetical protein
MIIGHVDRVFERRLQRDLAVLTTLAHLGCATFPQVQALCFPTSINAARLSLANLITAGYLTQSPWFLQQVSGARGRVWTMTAKGRATLHHYAPLPPAQPPLDLGCPRTPMEYDAWRARLQVRTLLVALILEARRTAFLSSLAVTPLDRRPLDGRVAHLPDALLQIGWQTPRVQPPEWLPWDITASTAADVHYAVYLDRAPGVPPLHWLALRGRRPTTPVPRIPVVVLADEERVGMVQRAVVAANYPAPVRVSTWDRLTTGVGRGQWRDAHGQPCGLQPVDAAP